MWLIGIMLVQTGNQVFDVHIVENCSCLDIHVLSPFVGLFSNCRTLVAIAAISGHCLKEQPQYFRQFL